MTADAMAKGAARSWIGRYRRQGETMTIDGPGSKICPPERGAELLEAIIEPGDPVVIAGDNQKRADFPVAALAKADPRLANFPSSQLKLSLATRSLT
jgi:hypothetical protein